MSTDSPQRTTSDALSESARLLLVDDDEVWLDLVGDLFTDEVADFEVVTATSLKDGRQQFAEDAFECVVCDYRLGDGTGLDLLADVRRSDSDLPFILVTSRGDESVAADAISKGVTDYIQKSLIREDFDTPAESALATQLRKAVQAYRTQRALTQQREIKTTTMDLLTTVSNQSELYQQFCDLLRADHGYDGVWLGTIGGGGRIIPRAVSGCGKYVQTLDRSTTNDASRYDPAIRALQEQTVAVSTTAEDRPAEPWHDDWRTETAAHEFDAGVGIPVGDDRTQFGVLGAYTTAAELTDSQIELLRELTQIISYKFRTDEWTESMMSDEPVWLEIEIEATGAPLPSLAERLPSDGPLTVRSVAKHGDGQMLYSIRLPAEASRTIREHVAGEEHIQLEEATERADGQEYLLVVEPPTPERIARKYGMQCREIEIEPNRRTIVGYLSTNNALPNLLADLRSTYEQTTVTSVTSNSLADSPMSSHWATTTTEAQLLEPLTNRQRELLSQAVHAGYFDQPRRTNATELADRVGIARATLTQHLRTAQQKLLTRLFTGGDER